MENSPRVSQWAYFKITAAIEVVKATGDFSDIQNPSLRVSVQGILFNNLLGARLCPVKEEVA